MKPKHLSTSSAVAARVARAVKPAKAVKSAKASKPQPAIAAPPVYGQTYYDSGATYPKLDPVALPVDDGGKVKLGTAKLPDMDFIRLLSAENDAMTANPNYTSPIPPVVDMAAIITQLQSEVTLVTNLKRQWMEATSVKDATRALAETMFANRAGYVQQVSNGNSALILNAGFELRKAPTRTGVLSPPDGLRVDLNGTAGHMIVSWLAVEKAKTYLLQYAVQNDQEPVWIAVNAVGKRLVTLEDMTVGVTYLFRLAAAAGTGTQSAWSPVVSRTAA